MKARRAAVIALAVGVMQAGACAAVTETFTRKTYAVHLQPGMSLLQALNAATPVRIAGKLFHGATNWHVNWRFRYTGQPGGLCAITSVDTQLSVTMTLPELRPASAAATAEFARYLPALVEHEQGHRRIAQETAQAIDDAIARLAPLSGCEPLAAEANRLGQALIERSKGTHADYDAATRHGCTQGACLYRSPAAQPRQ